MEDERSRRLDDGASPVSSASGDGEERGQRVRDALQRNLGPLPDAAVRELAQHVQWVTLPAGQWLFRQGDQPDAAYLVLSGRLRVLQDNGTGSGDQVADVGRGELVGELALLHETSRNASVLAVRDTDLACLPRALFDRLMTEHPSALLQVVRAIAARFQGPVTTPVGGAAGRIVAMVGLGRDISELATAVVAALEASGRVLRVDPHVLAAHGVQADRPTGDDSQRLRAWLHAADDDNDLVVLVGDGHWTGWSAWIADQADHIVLVADAGSDPTPGSDERRWSERSAARRPHCTLVLCHPADADRARDTRAWLDQRDVDAHLHLRDGHPGDIQRLARHLTSTGIAVVLGGGGARGSAHIGVMQALEELRVPVDLWVGTSFGAVVAGLAGRGMMADEVAQELPALVRRIRDYTPPAAALLRGQRITDSIRQMFDDFDVSDLWLPTLMVTTCLTTSMSMVHRRGSAVRALRASVAIPGVLPPVAIDGYLHVDGGVLDNLPVRVARQHLGVGRVIAVNVSPQDGAAADQDFGLDVSGWRLLADRMRRQPKHSVPGLATTVVRSLMVSAERERRAVVEEELADCFLDLDLGDVGLLAFGQVPTLVERGRRAALPPLQAWLEHDDQAFLRSPAARPAPAGGR